MLRIVSEGHKGLYVRGLSPFPLPVTKQVSLNNSIIIYASIWARPLGHLIYIVARLYYRRR